MIKEEVIVGKDSEFPLNGMLILPDDTTNPVPAVVFVHGAGMSDMDESVGSMTPFKDLAEGLVEYGIASLRYDKRTYAHMARMMEDTSLLVSIKEETTDDALLATELLKNDPRIDENNVFIIGHNLGGMMAPRLDDEGGNYKGLILIGSTPRKLENILIDQNNANLAKMNILLRFLYRSSANQFNSSFKGIYNLSDEKAKRKLIGSGVSAYYFKDIGEHTIERYLDTLHKPMFIIQGDKDNQVRVDLDFNGYKTLLNDRENVVFKLYENLNHYLISDVDDGTERHVENEVINDIANWILKSAE